MKINNIAFVGIPVTNMKRAREFYEGVLGLKPSDEMGHGKWVEYDLGPVTIGVGCHPAWKPSHDGTTVAFEVEDFDGTYEKLKSRGVTFDLDKTETPVCWMAQFRDPDANKLLIHKRKK